MAPRPGAFLVQCPLLPLNAATASPGRKNRPLCSSLLVSYCTTDTTLRGVSTRMQTHETVPYVPQRLPQRLHREGSQAPREEPLEPDAWWHPSLVPCTCPMPAYRGAEGITFKRREGYADSKGFMIPCGQCIGCRLDKSRAWGVRCANEAALHDQNCFVTRTYDDDHLPSDGSVSKRENQLFFKRLRKKIGQFRFLSCGEYGGREGRPHYHDVLFGVSFFVDRYRWGTSKSGLQTFRSPLLESVWPFGHCVIQDFHPDAGKYVASYTLKQSSSNRQRINPHTGEIYEVAPEFLLMSRRPGLGSGWWDKFQAEAISNEFIVIDGSRQTIPAYYVNKMSEEDQNTIKTNRRLRANQQASRERILHEGGDLATMTSDQRAAHFYEAGQSRGLTKHKLAIHNNDRTERDNGEQ